jgi:hypothetical protein
VHRQAATPSGGKRRALEQDVVVSFISSIQQALPQSLQPDDQRWILLVFG